jgi:hypothetical protein
MVAAPFGGATIRGGIVTHKCRLGLETERRMAAWGPGWVDQCGTGSAHPEDIRCMT